MAAKENISESHKRFLFFFLRLSSGCLSVTAWLAKRSWVGWQSHWCMALPRASRIPSPKTSSKPGPSHLSVSLPWGLAPSLAPHGWSHVHSTPWWRQGTRPMAGLHASGLCSVHSPGIMSLAANACLSWQVSPCELLRASN